MPAPTIPNPSSLVDIACPLVSNTDKETGRQGAALSSGLLVSLSPCLGSKLGQQRAIRAPVDRQRHRTLDIARQNDRVGQLERHAPLGAVGQRPAAFQNG